MTVYKLFVYLFFSSCLLSHGFFQVHSFTAPSYFTSIISTTRSRRKGRNTSSRTISTRANSSITNSDTKQSQFKYHASVNPNNAIGTTGAGSSSNLSSSFSKKNNNNPNYKLSLSRISMTIASTYFTWYTQKNYSNVMASSAITLLVTLIISNIHNNNNYYTSLSNAVFCGTFAGMSSKVIIPSTNSALLLGTMTSVLYEGMIQYRNQFVGLGGRLGLMAFVSTWMVVAFMKSCTASSTAASAVSLAAAASAISNFAKLNPLSWSNVTTNILPMVFWHIVGSIMTLYLRTTRTTTSTSTSTSTSDERRIVSMAMDPVRAAAVVAMTGALLLQDHKTAALALYGGSFVGMSAPSRLCSIPSIHNHKNKDKNSGGGGGSGGSGARAGGVAAPSSPWLGFGIAAALAGVVHGITMDWGLWMGGWGGKAGACAFVGCVLYRCWVACWISALRVVVGVGMRRGGKDRPPAVEEVGMQQQGRGQ